MEFAAATGRTKSRLISEALPSYVATEQQFLNAIKEGKKALREGKVVDHATVVAAFERSGRALSIGRHK